MDISIENAKKDKLFYIVASGFIFREKDKKILLMKRSSTEKVLPGYWGGVGGKLEFRDLFDNEPDGTDARSIPAWWFGMIEKLMIREAKEESGLKVKNPIYTGNLVFIRPDNIPVVCLKYAMKYNGGEVKLAPEFDDYTWVDLERAKKLPLVANIEELRRIISTFSNKKG